MYVGKDFDPSDPAENELYTLDFVNDLATGQAVASAVWTCTALKGVDASASSRLSGAATVSGTKTLQRVIGLQPGVYYELKAVATLNDTSVVSLWSHVICNAPK